MPETMVKRDEMVPMDYFTPFTPLEAATDRVRSLYGVDDVEFVAERLEISVSDEETQAILANIDGEIDRIAAHATRHAVEVRIADLLAVVGRAHTASDDD